jgi:hypothetical protein
MDVTYIFYIAYCLARLDDKAYHAQKLYNLIYRLWKITNTPRNIKATSLAL